MFRFSLALRLMLAMMGVVSLVSASLFVVTQRSLEAAWQEVMEARFVSQMESLASLQKARLDSMGGRCRELAASSVVWEALERGGGSLPAEVHRELLERARVVQESASSFEGQDGWRRPGRGGPGSGGFGGAAVPAVGGEAAASGGGRDRRQGGVRWVRPGSLDLALMDAGGRVHSLKTGPEAEVQTAWLERHHLSQVPAVQEVAYLAVKPAEGSRFRMPLLREIILTPITKPGEERPLGALIVGLPVSSYGETALYDLSRRGRPGDLHTGLWIDDQLFSRSLPREAVEAVSSTVRATLQAPEAGDRRPILSIGGKQWQLLYRSLNPESSAPQAWRVSLYSLDGLMAQREELRRQTIALAGAALVVAAALSWFLARRLVLPVRDLVAGVRQLGQGDYDARVAVSTRDELATLAGAFNEMAAGLKQRQQYRDILFQVSDDDIARQLMETACLGGERREISVLFCDIRNFTITTSGMSPENVIDLLNEHMTALTEVVHRHHGVVDKFVGDLIMAIFGAPKTYGDDAGHAAACALEMMERRRVLNQTTAHPALAMGIGVASGTAIAGCMGSESRLNYTVLGEPVNLASRLCSAAGPDEVRLDARTVERLGRRAVGVWSQPLALKGFAHPVESFLLTGLELVVNAVTVVDGVRPAGVGGG